MAARNGSLDIGSSGQSIVENDGEILASMLVKDTQRDDPHTRFIKIMTVTFV